jgi:hypothetical protein
MMRLGVERDYEDNEQSISITSQVVPFVIISSESKIAL